MRPRLLPLLVAALLALHTVDPASAAWTTSAAGDSRAAGGALAPPTAVVVTWNPVVHVSWTATTSSWATGYRVFRSVSAGGPWTQVADVGPAVTTVDDQPGAGTHHYTVRAYRGAWSSLLSDVVARADPTYVLKDSTGFTGAGCTAGPASRFDMQQGWSTAGGVQLSRRRADGDFAFCSDTFSTGQALAAGNTSVNAWFTKSNGSICHVTLTLLANGTTALGSGVIPVTQNTTLHLLSTEFSTNGWPFADGDRLQLRVTWETNTACNGTHLHWNSAAAPSHVTLTG